MVETIFLRIALFHCVQHFLTHQNYRTIKKSHKINSSMIEKGCLEHQLVDNQITVKFSKLTNEMITICRITTYY